MLLGLCAVAGVAKLFVIRELGGFSMKLVSVVRKVSSPRSGFEGVFEGEAEREVSAFFWARVKDSGIGAYGAHIYQRRVLLKIGLVFQSDRWSLTSGKSTQNAFIFMPYKNAAKLSLNLAKLSCMSCKCIKLASRSAIESLNSANAGSSPSNGKAEALKLWLPGVNDWLSRSDVREDGRSGVEGRDGGFRVADIERFD